MSSYAVFCDFLGLTSVDYRGSIKTNYCDSPKGGFVLEKLFDAELRLMEIIWKHEPITAKEISLITTEQFGWNKNTTYTVIKRLIEKGVLHRGEPGFLCSSILKKSDVQRAETKTLIEKLFGGSKKAFFATFADEKLSSDEVEALKALIEEKG